MSISMQKKLLIICVYPLTWKSTGKDVNDSWKYIPTALSKKCKVIYFSFSERTLAKRYFFSNFLNMVTNYLFSPLVIFEPIEGKILRKLHWHVLLFLLSLNKKIVIISSLPDERVFKLTKWHRPILTYDCTDQMCDMNDTTSDSIAKNIEREFIQKCDITFVNSHSLFQLKRLYSSNVKIVPAGFPLKLYFDLTPTEKRHDRLTAVYIGAISFRFDFNLLNYVIRNNPNINFVFIGPYLDLEIDWMKKMDAIQQTKKQWHEIVSLSNVQYLGYMDRKHIHAMSSGFDIGIIPYDVSQEFNRYCNPVKFYDYLAMGKPIVSTDILELRRYKKNKNIKIALNKYVFSTSIRSAFQVTDRYIRYARSVAQRNDVDRKAAKMLREIYGCINIS
jgi:glycosyltransferase involved in cell wall biosynthesis